MILFKNADIYAPEHIGPMDLFVCGGQVQAMEPELSPVLPGMAVIDCCGKRLIPGLIDQHVHITGGGGEGGFHTRAPEVMLSKLTTNGVTTVVGLLGTDATTRSVENLVAKTKALKNEGISAYCCTGSYGVPTTTLTGTIEKDIAFVEEIIGTKTAISDHRDSGPSDEAFFHLVSRTRTAGMIGGKAGVVVIHLGDGRRGMEPVFRALEVTDIPVKTMRPTHLNRSVRLVEEGLRFAKMGGMVDFTCGMGMENRPAAVIRRGLTQGVPADRMTFSSDGYGSWSRYDETGNLVKIGLSSVAAIHQELVEMVRNFAFPLEQALPFVTTNVADGLELSNKGRIRPGGDADLVLLNDDMTVSLVVARGRVMVRDGVAVVKGTYED